VKELNMFVSRETLVKKITESNGQIITVDFIKKDGSKRTLNGRIGVKAHVKGTGRPMTNYPHLIGIYDLQVAKANPENPEVAYRAMIKDNILAARINGESYEVR
jgi:hypothetical protein